MAKQSRHAGRQQALEILYEADLRRMPIPAVLAARLGEDDVPSDFAVALVRGVHRNAEEIDQLIASHARGWSLHRMPVIDRNLLRLGLFELLHSEDDVPAPVAIDEAVQLAKELSTDDSPRFINGVLGKIADEHVAARAAEAAGAVPPPDDA